MKYESLFRRLMRAESLLLAVLALAACAKGLDPDRSALDGTGGESAGGGGSTFTSGGTTTSTGPGGTTTTTTTTTSTSTTGGAGGTTTTSTSTTGGAGGTTTTSTSTTGGTGGTPDGVHLQYKVGDTNASNGEIKAVFNIVNDSMDPVDVNALAIRYYYTLDGGPETQQFHCDYAFMGCGKVVGSFATATGVNTDHYMEVTFAGAGTLAPGAQTGEIQSRWNKTDFSVLNETSDYSFDPTKLSFADWENVTLHHNGTLVWGVEP